MNIDLIVVWEEEKLMKFSGSHSNPKKLKLKKKIIIIYR